MLGQELMIWGLGDQLVGDILIRLVVLEKMMEMYPRLTPGGALVSYQFARLFSLPYKWLIGR